MRKVIFPLLFGLFFPSLGYAHVAGHGGGFMAGLSHPVFGLDHFLAMIGGGILGVQTGGRARWIAPSVLLCAMLGGGILGMRDVQLPYVELGIASSVLTLGIALAIKRKPPLPLAMFLVAFFAIFHGHAHGAEMPGLAKPALYACGFLSGAAGIHLVGFLVGVSAGALVKGAQLLRYVGTAVAGIGFHLLYIICVCWAYAS